MTTDEILDAVIMREGGYVEDPSDRGGPTKFGITANTLGACRQLGRPATREEVKHLSVTEAREMYRRRYVSDPGFDAIPDDELRAQLVDDAVLSGPMTAISELQGVLGVTRDGLLGPKTRAALARATLEDVRKKLAVTRALRLARIVRDDPTQARFLVGWLTRALSFV